jgi:hypothetical protein
MKLHEIVKRTYDKILKPIFKVEVLSDKGWEEISSLNISENKEVYEITTENEMLLCTGDHIVIDENNEEIFAKDTLHKHIKCKSHN